MNLSKLAVKRPVTIMMAVLIVVLLGTVSLLKLPIDLLPKIEIPIAVVSTNYAGVGPEEIENMITKPIEEAVGTVANIDKLTSTSSEGNSVVVVEFTFGTDMDVAALEMREKIDLVKGYLPDEATEPMVLKIDPNAMPIMQISLSGSNDLATLQAIAEDTIKPRLERIEGVASVSVTGGMERQIEIKLNQQKIKGYGLSLDRIAQIIGAENLNLPGGEVKKGNKELTIRTLGKLQSIEDIKQIPIPLQNGGVIYLKDVAEVKLDYKESSTISKLNGEKSIEISIQKQSGTNTVKVADKVNEELEKLKRELLNVEINTVTDQSEFIQLSIDNVIKNAIVGAFLAVIILYIFLRNMRTTLIIGTSIPVSIIATFILVYFFDITLNLMTLGGLALGVGMLVDNAIVVLENIYRFRQEGYSREEAAIKGANEVGMAVTASTLTTIAVFLPIVYVEGIASTIFKELALTVTLSLIASLGVSLTLIPMLSSKLLKVDDNQGKKHKRKFRILSFLFDIFDKVLDGLTLGYKKVLNWSLGHRKTTVISVILIFVLSMASILNVGSEFFPSMDEGQFQVKISLPEGAEINETNEIIEEIEGYLEGIEDIETVLSSIGSGGMFGTTGGSTNQATISVTVKSLAERKIGVSEIADQVREGIKDIPGAEKSVEISSSNMMGGGMGGGGISINVKGDDIDTLKKISDEIKGIVETVEGTKEVETGLSEGVPEVQIEINRNKASQYGLTAAQIASSVKSTISGKVATRYKYEEKEIDVLIKGDETFKQSIANLKQTPIQTPTGVSVPLSQVADVKLARGPSKISRENQVRVVSITSQILGRDMGSVSDDIETKLAEYDMPKGYSYEFTGENEDLKDAFSDLGLALVLAVVLVFMILASQFESLLHPFAIMLSVPMAFAGGALGLFITGKALSVVALIGFIMLAGIVVNNAIVLIDYINTRRSNGEERKEAIVNAGPTRLRPILMTTLTTVLGLVPLALGIGEGSEMQAPLAITVIGGLLLSTVITLVFVPVVYTIFDDLANFIKRKIFRKAV